MADRRCRWCGNPPPLSKGGRCAGCVAEIGARCRATKIRLARREFIAGKLCRHCGKLPVARARGLCNPCYCRPQVRGLYPPQPKPGLGLDGNATPPLPAEPTDARPGSPEKVAVMAARALAGEQVFHPRDATIPVDPPDPYPVALALRRATPMEDDADDE